MPKVLIIDDDKLAGAAIQILLRARGHVATLVHDGAIGIESVKADPPDVVIVDLFMPKMNGLEVMAAIRAFNPDMPMIAASGFMFDGPACPEMPGFAGMATEAGAVATIYKPFRPDQVLQAIEHAIGSAPKPMRPPVRLVAGR